MQVDVQGVGLVEFPDDTSDEEIQSSLNELFPPDNKLSPETLKSLAGEEERQRQATALYGSTRPFEAEGDFARSIFTPIVESPGKVGQALHAAMQPLETLYRPVFQQIREGMNPSNVALTGEFLPELKPGESIVHGLEPPAGEAGIIPSLRRTAAGITTPGSLGILPFAGGTGILPRTIQGTFALGAAANIPEAISRVARAETPAETRGALTDLGTDILFAGGMGREATRPQPPREAALSQLRTALESEPVLTPRTLDVPPSLRELGIPQPTLSAEPFLQPGVPELASAAMREAVGPRLEIPGEISALERLRRELEPQIVPVEPTRLAERVEGGGEAPYGKVSYQREAEAPTTERTQNAIQQEATGAIRNVREQEVTQQGEVEVPSEISSSKAAEAQVEIPSFASKYNPETLMQRPAWVEPGSILDKVLGELRDKNDPQIGRDIAPIWKTLSPEQRQDLAARGWVTTSTRDPRAVALKIAQDVGPARNYYAMQAKRSPEARVETPLTDMINKWFEGGEKPIEKAKEETLLEKLESMKLPETGEGRLYSLPHPDAIKAIGRTTWNTAVDVAIAAVKAGKAIGEAIEAALAHIRKNASGKFDETQARANLEYITKAEGPKIFPTEGESVAMRKSAERATTSPMIPEPVQETIRTAPESFYTQQSMRRVEDTVSAMSDTDLSNVPRDSNIYTAAKLEQADRLFKAGNNDAGYNVFVELEKEGTRLGQLINQFKLLKGTRPEEIVRVINRTLTKEGKDPLTKEQQTKATDIATKAKETDRALDTATDEWTKNPTPENAAKAEKALTDSNNAAVELQRFISRFSPRSTASLLKAILQGNFLTPISETANLFGNVSNLPWRSATRTGTTALDILDNYLTGHPRQITVQPVRGTVEAAKGFARGAAKIPDVLMRGTGDVIKGETRAGLHPLQAWINQFAKNPEMPTTGGKLTLQDRVNLAIEGTFGVPAEAMLRGLGAGDVPFREAAHARAIATELELANVSKEQRSFYQKFPELILSETALKRIQDSTLRAIFQQPSKLLSMFTGWLRGKGAWWDLLVATVAPYKLTPWNIIGEVLSYNPLIALGKTINHARLGNRLEAKIYASKFVVGSVLTTAGWWLYKKGLMSPSLDQSDEQQKARILAGEVMPPNHINISGLQRALKGGDPSYKKGDETRDVFRAGGLAGSMFYMTANIGRQFEREPEVSDSEIWGSIIRQSTLEQARFGMNQSFLQGVEGLLAAVREGNTDQYIKKWAGGLTSVALPNTLTVMSRASREYQPDIRDESFRKQMDNVIKNKLGFANLDEYLPLKRGLWGEPMRETPEGRNAIMYHFFDVFKGKQVTSDPVPLELYRLWRKTTDTRVIPSLPEAQLTVGGNNYKLTSAQHSRYAELVGQNRRRIVDAVVVNPKFYNLPDEAKIDVLDRIYRAGMDQGKAKFWYENRAALTPKPHRAGFQPAASEQSPAQSHPDS